MKEEQVNRFIEKMLEEMPEAVKGLMPKITKKFLDLELGPPHMHTLKTISEHKNLLKISEISKELSISFAMMTRIIDRLELRGLVSRTSDPNDRRAIRVKLTPRGKVVSRKMKDFQKKHMIKVLNKFEEKDREAFMEAIDRITSILSKYGREI